MRHHRQIGCNSSPSNGRIWQTTTTTEETSAQALPLRTLRDNASFLITLVRARGKRTPYTSVSLERHAIERFGECDCLLLRHLLNRDKHALVDHAELIRELRLAIRERKKADRLTTIQALRYARLRKEGLIVWKFDYEGVERKELITWTYQKVQE
jgi:hypothetical protein